MLTQDQKEKLYPLTLHPKFDKLLISAMKTWETCNPTKNDFGITKWNDSEKESEWQVHKNGNKCCLTGASIVGQNSKDYPVDEVRSTFDLSENEVDDLTYGFDLRGNYSEESEAFRFGYEV